MSSDTCREVSREVGRTEPPFTNEAVAEEKGHEVEEERGARNHNEGETTDTWHDFLEEYKLARDTYLQHKLIQSVLNVGKTFDGQRFDVPTVDEAAQVALNEARARVLKEIEDSVSRLRKLTNECQIRQESLENRRNEVQQMKNRSGEPGCADMELDSVSVEEQEITDEDLQKQETRICQLQEKRQQMMHELTSVREEVHELEKSLSGEKENFRSKNIDVSEVSLEIIRGKCHDISSQISRYVEMQQFYFQLREIFEEISGIRIVSVGSEVICCTGEENVSKMINRNEVDSRIVANPGLVIVLELLNQYKLQVGLETFQCKAKFQGEFLRINYAKYLDFPMNDNLPRPELFPAPKLDDLIHFSNQQQKKQLLCMRGGGMNNYNRYQSLHILVKEVAMRLAFRCALIEELALLESVVDSVELIPEKSCCRNTGVSADASCGVDGGFTIACRIGNAKDPDSLLVVLRIAPFCPGLEGSLHVQELKFEEQKGNRNQSHLVKTLENFFAQRHPSRPVEAIDLIRNKLNCKDV